jgi:hypothetical protein
MLRLKKPKRKLQSDLSDFSVVGPRILLSLTRLARHAITVPRPPSLPDARPAGGDQNCRGCPAAPPLQTRPSQWPRFDYPSAACHGFQTRR